MLPFLVQFLVKVSDLVGIIDNEFLKGLFAIKASIKSYQLIIVGHVYFLSFSDLPHPQFKLDLINIKTVWPTLIK